MIRRAPLAFAFAVGIAAVCMFFGFRAFYERELRIKDERIALALAGPAAKPGPIRLSREQQAKIGEALDDFAGQVSIEVGFVEGRTDGASLATDLVRAFKLAGLSAKTVPLKDALFIGYGVQVFAKSSTPAALAVIRSLLSLGLRVQDETAIGLISEGQIFIEIGDLEP